MERGADGLTQPRGFLGILARTILKSSLRFPNCREERWEGGAVDWELSLGSVVLLDGTFAAEIGIAWLAASGAVTDFL
jgi:hypothetical protein